MKYDDFGKGNDCSFFPESDDLDFVCPCCEATYEEIRAEAGTNANGSVKNLIHNHHDHIADGMRELIFFGANDRLVTSSEEFLTGFASTRICHRCNAAEFGLLKKKFILPDRPELKRLVSFPPSAIRLGVRRVPGGKHILHPDVTGLLKEELEEVIHRAEQAADLINGIRNAMIGTDQRQVGGVIDAVLEPFTKSGLSPGLHHKVLGPLDWISVTQEIRWLDNLSAPMCDLTTRPVRGNHYLHDFHTGETISGFINQGPENVRDRFCGISTFQTFSHRGPGYVKVKDGFHITEFQEEARGAYSCESCAPSMGRSSAYICNYCSSDANLVRQLLCCRDWFIFSNMEVLSFVSWSFDMRTRIIDMNGVIELFQKRTGTVRDSILPFIKEACHGNVKKDLSETLVKTARSASSFADLLENLMKMNIHSEVHIPSKSGQPEWIRFHFDGDVYTGSQVHFQIGDIAAYGLRFDPSAEMERVRPFRYKASKAENREKGRG